MTPPDPVKEFKAQMKGKKFATILADPPWRFQNRTGKMAPEHRRLSRYGTMELAEIAALPVHVAAAETAHLYLWVPNALLPEGIQIMKAWGFEYKSNIVWHKIRKDGGPDGRGVGFYFRNVTELVLFGVRGFNPVAGGSLPPGFSNAASRGRCRRVAHRSKSRAARHVLRLSLSGESHRLSSG
jgi:N6-adenosine-specific RNA methylase IME4